MEVSPQEFSDVQILVRSLCGLVLTGDKTYLVSNRLEPVVKSHGCKTIAEYLGRLQQSHAIAMRDELVEALTTRETSFLRDAHPFSEFRRQILPALAEVIRRRIAERHPAPFARIWSAGCSTGQEPYGLAICVLEFLSANPACGLRPGHFPILATDVSGKSLTIAKDGCYSEREMDRGISMDMRTRYFIPQGTSWTIRSDLKKCVEFRRLNFIDRVADLGPFEVIFCRNVLIYFDLPTRQRLCQQFHQLLSSDGLLIVGAAESLYGLDTPFQSETVGTTTVYRKTQQNSSHGNS